MKAAITYKIGMINMELITDPFGRHGGPYLDAQALIDREVKSAAIEGREVDLSPANLDPTGTIPVFTEAPVSDETASLADHTDYAVAMEDAIALIQTQSDTIAELQAKTAALEAEADIFTSPKKK
jgi:hypothetical protein